MAGANTLFVVWIWWRNGGILNLHKAGDPWVSLGRLTGLLGAYLALVQLLLIGRLPPLERLVGFDRLTIWHRLNGKICLGLVLAHTALITIGYMLNDGFSFKYQVRVLLTSTYGVLAATVGTALMVVVVGTSLVVVRRQLPYELWYAVHLTVYAAIALAWFHQIPTGDDLNGAPTLALYWRLLYVLTAVLLIGFRVVAPIVNWFRFGLHVSEVNAEGPDVVSLRVTGRGLERLHARPGQFFIWRFLSPEGWWQPHPFSLSAPPDGRSLRLTIKNSGNFTRRAGAIRPGTQVIAEGPFGVFTDVVRSRDKVALIAGGIGITPLRTLFETLSCDVVLVYRATRDEDVVFRHELNEIAERRGARIEYVVGERDAAGADLLSTRHLVELVPDIDERDVYISGPPAMVDAIESNVREAGVPRRQVHTERFAL